MTRHEIDDTMPDPCPECDCQLYTMVYKVEVGDQHDADHDNKHRSPVIYRCEDCGCEQQVRPTP